jgi:hypothetical protein
LCGLPGGFPHSDLIVLTAFAVVLGALLIQGLTLKPLLRALDLHDGDPVARHLLRRSNPVAELLRKELKARQTEQPPDSAGGTWRAKKSATTPSIAWKTNSTGSKWPRATTRFFSN